MSLHNPLPHNNHADSKSQDEHLKISDLLGLSKEIEEDPQGNESLSDFSQRTARNLLRFLFLGTTISKTGPYQKSLSAIENVITKQLDDDLLKAARTEIQNILLNSWTALQKNNLHRALENQFEIFLNNLLADYPFMNPKSGETLKVPQKINGEWQQITYQLTPYDLSPSSGLQAKLLSEKDHYYAWTLTSVEPVPSVKSHILFMGTPHNTCQGAGLAYLYNFYPRHSPGEGHDNVHLDKWISQQPDKSIQVTGHSKGAVMANIAAARHPKKIYRASCYNPTALSQATLDRLLPSWNKLNKKEKPKIDIYTQLGDPCFPLQRGFLPGSTITRVTAVNKKYSKYKGSECIEKIFENHVHSFSGYDQIRLEKIDTNKENHLRKRELRGDIQDMINWPVFAMLWHAFYLDRLIIKFKQFNNHHPWVVRILGGLVVLGVCAALSSTVFFAPLAGLGLVKAISIAGGISIAAVLASPWINKLSAKLILFAETIVTYTTLVTLTLTTLILTPIMSMLKIGLKSLFTNNYKSTDIYVDDVITPRSFNSSSTITQSIANKKSNGSSVDHGIAHGTTKNKLEGSPQKNWQRFFCCWKSSNDKELGSNRALIQLNSC